MANENSVNRELPGVKGQWILCSDCPPTPNDIDRHRVVQVYGTRVPRRAFRYEQVQDVMPIEYWRPLDYLDTRPFTLEPASIQPVTAERRIVQLSRHGDLVYVAADDGTAWVRYADLDWRQIPALPPREA